MPNLPIKLALISRVPGTPKLRQDAAAKRGLRWTKATNWLVTHRRLAYVTPPMLYNDIEREALKAADDVRRDWLHALEKDLAALPAKVGKGNRLMMEHAIRMLRRRLGIKQSDEERRAKTRERVRKFRNRKG